jgi:RimJ/RimL family protein N-acetyltransferase
MNLESQRLVLRGFVHEDWKDLYEYLSDEHVVKYEPYGTLSADNCKKEAERRSEDESFRAVCLKEGKLIGNVYFQLQPPAEFLTWEIGFVFNRHYHGRGYATEACGRILRYAFEELGAHRVIGNCNPENTASWKLMERLGMRREGHFIKPAFFSMKPDGKPAWHDAYQYAILEEEWFSKQ